MQNFSCLPSSSLLFKIEFEITMKVMLWLVLKLELSCVTYCAVCYHFSSLSGILYLKIAFLMNDCKFLILNNGYYAVWPYIRQQPKNWYMNKTYSSTFTHSSSLFTFGRLQFFNWTFNSPQVFQIYKKFKCTLDEWAIVPWSDFNRDKLEDGIDIFIIEFHRLDNWVNVSFAQGQIPLE